MSQPGWPPRHDGMAHLEPRPARGAGLLVRLAYRAARRRLGRVPTPVAIMAHHRAILAATGGFELAFERAHAVEDRLKHLVMVKVASLVGCRFCIDIGEALAVDRGVTEAELRALPFFEEEQGFTALERDALAYAVQMTETPATPDAALCARLREALGVPGVIELTAAIAWENFRARFNHAVGATEDGFSSHVVCLLPRDDHG